MGLVLADLPCRVAGPSVDVPELLLGFGSL